MSEIKILRMEDLESFQDKQKEDSLKEYRNNSVLIITATRGKTKKLVTCPHCKETHEIEYNTGIHPWVIESWKRIVKPMNNAVYDMIISGYEVAEAYNIAIDAWLTNESLANINYIMFMEDDVMVPSMPETHGPLIALLRHMDNFDVASGLYYTKGIPSLPLIYGDGNMDQKDPFKVNIDWNTGDVVEVNGCGMGFTMMKKRMFLDHRLEKPFFRTINEVNKDGGVTYYTQDLYFYEKIKKLGYRICVDTNIKCTHLDVNAEVPY